jgi:hypothetical protein
MENIQDDSEEAKIYKRPQKFKVTKNTGKNSKS